MRAWSREWSRSRPLAGPLHVASLLAALGFLLWVNRHHWFIGDEWAAIVDRRLGGGGGTKGIWEPHNEHWATIPIVAFRGLFTLFGTRTYWPYVVLLLSVHLAIVHLLWRLMRRLQVEPLLATALCAVFAVLGAGGQNLVIAWQVQLIAPLALGLGALLLVPSSGPLRRRDAWVVALLVVGLMCSGVGLTMLVVVGLVAVRRGWRVAAAIVGPPVAVYGAWYVAYGRDATTRNADSLGVALQKLPQFVWRGLTDAADGTFGLAGIGPVVIVALAVWAVVRSRPSSGGVDNARWDVALALAVGAVVFLGFTDLRRSGLGIGVAGASRYVYVVVALLLPLGAVALDALLGHTTARVPVTVGLAALLLAVQVPELNHVAQRWDAVDRNARSLVLGSAVLARDEPSLLTKVPVPREMPNLTLKKIAALDRDGELPDDVTPVDVLSARLAVQVVVADDASDDREAGAAPALELVRNATDRSGADAGAGASSDCVQLVPAPVDPGFVVRVDEPGSLVVTTGVSARLGLRLTRGDTVSNVRTVATVADVPQRIRLEVAGVGGGGVALDVAVPTAGVTSVCHVSGTSRAPTESRA